MDLLLLFAVYLCIKPRPIFTENERDRQHTIQTRAGKNEIQALSKNSYKDHSNGIGFVRYKVKTKASCNITQQTFPIYRGILALCPSFEK